MRASSASASFSVTLVQLGGWLLVGFLAWLLLLSHEGMAAPARVIAPESVTILTSVPAEVAAQYPSRRPMGVRSAHSGQSNLLGLLLPRPNLHRRTDAARAALRAPNRVRYERTHARGGHRSKVGGLLLSVFQRNVG